MAVGTLYIEELSATMRGRFAWLGAGVTLFAVGCVATVGTQDTWLDGYGIIAYFLVPLAFIPLSAVFLASPRANRFVESVFTAPVERGDWLAAKISVLVTLAAAYYAALVPMVLVYIHHVGVPPLLWKLLIWAPCLLLVSIAIGALIGVLFIGQSIAAPAATGMGVLPTPASCRFRNFW
jgi:ABC-type multidrug transport system permease subunit